MRIRSNITTKDGITWYYEQEGSGPQYVTPGYKVPEVEALRRWYFARLCQQAFLVIIPDGFGECQMFDIPIPMIASHGFTVTTFDMPGMSRSSNAPPETYENVTAQKLAGYVIGLLDALNIDIATFWGCSSGGSTVLAIASLYPERMRSGMPHETPTYLMDHLTPLFQESDDKISETMRDFIPEGSVGDVKAWEALGEEVHARLWKNYPRWGRGYPHTLPLSTPVAKEGLLKRPLSWTVGASTPTHLFLDNIVTAAKAGVKIGVIPGMHFPYVSHPQAWVEYVVKEAKKHL